MKPRFHRPYVLAIYKRGTPGFDGERNPYTAEKFVMILDEKAADAESMRLRLTGIPSDVLQVRMNPFP